MSKSVRGEKKIGSHSMSIAFPIFSHNIDLSDGRCSEYFDTMVILIFWQQQQHLFSKKIIWRIQKVSKSKILYLRSLFNQFKFFRFSVIFIHSPMFLFLRQISSDNAPYYRFIIWTNSAIYFPNKLSLEFRNDLIFISRIIVTRGWEFLLFFLLFSVFPPNRLTNDNKLFKLSTFFGVVE